MARPRYLARDPDAGGRNIAPVSRAALALHRRLPGYAATPLHAAPELAGRLGVRDVWLKDETQRLSLPSFKVLGASWALYRALEARRGAPFRHWDSLEEIAPQLAAEKRLTVATATDGNHGHAVAWLARRCGLSATIYLPRGVPASRRAAIAAEGARLVDVDGTYDEAVALCAAQAGLDTLVLADTSSRADDEVAGWVIEGYATMLWEIEDQLDATGAPTPDAIVVPLGVGALGAAVVRHCRGRRWQTRIVGFEPDRSACVMASVAAGRPVAVPRPHESIMAGLNCGTPSATAWPLLAEGFDLLLTLDDDAAAAGVRSLRRIGLSAGECAGGTVAAAELCLGPTRQPWRKLLGISAQSSIVLLLTEGSTSAAEAQRQV